MVLDERLIYEILSVVEEIPRGCVASYGQIAQLIGRERNARLVGKVLSHAVRLAPGFAEQEYLLRSEGVTFRENGYVDMKRHR